MTGRKPHRHRRSGAERDDDRSKGGDTSGETRTAERITDPRSTHDPHVLPAAPPAELEEAEVEIQSIAAGGDGVARADGRVVFIPRTAPGDRVRVRMTSVRGGRYARGTIVDLLRPSPHRVEPVCVHYTRDRCGGCQLQHLQYEEQLRVKSAIVRDALARIAGRPAPDVPATPSPERWRYRRKLTLALRRQAGGAWVAGLHRFDAPNEVFGLEMCPITDDGVLAVWRDVLGASDLFPDAPALRGAVRTTPSGYALVMEGGERWPQSAAFEAAVPALTEIWWVPERGPRRRVGVGTGHLPGQAAAPGVPTGTSFLQVNAAVGEALHADVVRRVLSYHPMTAIDAYAGTGGTAVALARAGVRVVAIEADRDASAQCAAALPAGSRAQSARVEDALPRALPADVVVLNPPRQGVAPAVTAALGSATSPPRAIVYVSCDPATLARDIGRLPAWRMASVQAFDMFPQTAHVETVCELVPAEVPS